MTLVVLSPHLDDAVLSAGGALASSAGALAITVFTEGKDAETRRKEDQAVLAPLGVGRHVDHRVVFEAARRVFPDARFYEDRPYAYEAGATAQRLAELSPLALTANETTYDAAIAARVRAAIDAYASQRELLATWFPARDDLAAYVERTFIALERP